MVNGHRNETNEKTEQCQCGGHDKIEICLLVFLEIRSLLSDESTDQGCEISGPQSERQNKARMVQYRAVQYKVDFLTFG